MLKLFNITVEPASKLVMAENEDIALQKFVGKLDVPALIKINPVEVEIIE